LLYLLPEIVEMKKMIRGSREKLDAHRMRLFRSQIRNIYQNIPFYREFFTINHLSPNDFRQLDDIKVLPIIEKQDIRQNPSHFLNDKIKIEKCFKSHTSGSTGEPFWSYFDRHAWIRKKYLSKLRARFACGMRPGEKVAIFSVDLPEKIQKSSSGNFLQTLVLKIKCFSIFDNLEIVLQRFCEFKPQNIYGPPGYFFHLARTAKQKKISTRYLKRIYTSSEFLSKSAAQFIQEVFQAEIYDVYGSTEFKEVAWECDRHQGYHINEDELICEILNKKAPARPGEVGDIILSDLLNRAMPLIRYRTRDRGMMIAESCRCGRVFSLMRPVAGRASEYIFLPDGQHLSPYLFTTSIERCKGLLQYQFIQTNKTDLLVKIILDERAGKGIACEIETIVKSITQGTMNISVEQTQHISIEENGKFKVVKSLLPNDPNLDSEFFRVSR
jgi:phenylacetate-CoA ligase